MIGLTPVLLVPNQRDSRCSRAICRRSLPVLFKKAWYPQKVSLPLHMTAARIRLHPPPQKLW